MKKFILTSLLALALSATASAALPSGGVYVGKDGTPLTEEQQTPPSLKSSKMAPQSQAISEALASLPHNATCLLQLTINEDGSAVKPVVAESSGSIILDQYAMDSVELWQFKPARRGDRAVSTEAAIPIRFTSSMVAVPAHATSEVLKDMSEEVSAAAARNQHPTLQVKVYVNADGTWDGKPEVLPMKDMPSSDFKLLSKYVESSVKTWTFAPAANPDGDSIGSEVVIPITL